MEEQESKYPSVDLAYDFVKPSYDWMIMRFESMNSRMQGLLTFATTLTAASPIIAKAIFNDINFSSLWFLGMIAAFLTLAAIGIVGISTGKIILINPQEIYKKYLHCSHWEFQQQVIFFAGEHFIKNNKHLKNKALYRDAMTILLLAEILCFAIWIGS